MVMYRSWSAGTGFKYSEFNPNADQKTTKSLNLAFPNKKKCHTSLPTILQSTNLTILQPEDDEGVWIHQDAWFHLVFDKESITCIHLKEGAGRLIYPLVHLTINGQAE
jgi:hypothetical protein